MFGITTTRRLRAELAAAKAETDRVRSERDEALEVAESWKTSAETSSELYTDTSIVNEHLTEDLTKARERIAELQAQTTSAAMAELRVRARAAEDRATVAEKRVKHLEKELDNATYLPAGGVQDSRAWQPGYQTPKAGTA